MKLQIHRELKSLVYFYDSCLYFISFVSAARVRASVLPVAKRVETGESADRGGTGQDSSAHGPHSASANWLL